MKQFCIKHEISPVHRAEFCALVMLGKRPSQEMRNRLKYVDNYKAALNEVLAALSAPYAEFFSNPKPSSLTKKATKQ